MEFEKFQGFMADQFAKLFAEFQGLRGEFQGLRGEFQGIKGEVQGIKEEVQGIKGEFQGLREEFQGLRVELKNGVAELGLKLTEQIQEVRVSQVSMESKFDLQISALHDFRISQDQANQDNQAAHTSFATKIEELQFEARITEQKLEEIAEDVSYLARKSFRHERQLGKLSQY